MKKILFILSFLQLLIGSEIKEKTLQVIKDYYQQEIKVEEFKFKIKSNKNFTETKSTTGALK